MAELDLALICLLIDQQTVENSIEDYTGNDWLSTCELFNGSHASQCIPPNEEFATNAKSLLYKISATGEKECNLDKWLQPIREDTLNELKSYFIAPANKETIKYRKGIFNSNVNKIAEHFPSKLETLLGMENLEVKTYVLNALDGKPDYELGQKSISYLEGVLKKSTEDKYEAKLVESAAKVLTSQVTHHDKDHKHVDFLADLIKCESYNDDLREVIFKKFSEDVSTIKNWENKQFDHFASLIDYDGDSHFLAIGLFNAYKYHGYTSSMEMLPYFEKLLDDVAMKETAASFVAKSLEKLLLNELSINSYLEVEKIESLKVIQEIEDHVINLLNKTGKLGSGLVSAIFEFYREDQSHFNELIVDLIAEDKLLSTELLRKLVAPLIKIEDTKTVLFIATRLVQHYIPLPPETLKHFIQFLNDKDEHIGILAVNLFYQKLATIPEEIKLDLAEVLITLLPTSSELQHSKINEILKHIKLSEIQVLKHGIITQIFDWHKASNLESKLIISKELLNKINPETSEELIPFFKDHLLSQNAALMTIAKQAFEKFGGRELISWSEKEIELLPLLDQGDFQETVQEGYFELKLHSGVRFLLTDAQLALLQEDIKPADRTKAVWSMENYIHRITATSFRDLSSLLELVSNTGFSEKEFIEALDESVDIQSLCQNLIDNTDILIVCITPIRDILDRAQKQEPVAEIQKAIWAWSRTDDLDEKLNISKGLYDKISDETIGELTPFFKEHLHTQNIDLLMIAKASFEKIETYQEIPWNTEEENLLLIMEAVDDYKENEIRQVTVKFVTGKNVEFWLSAQQAHYLQRELDHFSSKVSGYIKQIHFNDIRELRQLLDFIKTNELSELFLRNTLEENLSIAACYGKLLRGLIAETVSDSGLSRSYEKALKTIVDELKWPVNFLYSLIKNTEKGSFVKLISALEKLVDYGVRPDLADREGVTAFEILKNLPIEKLPQSISRVINDDHFYMTKDIGTLLEEISRSNPGNERLGELIKDKYFTQQLLKVGYELETTDTEPSPCEPNKLYVYKKSDRIYIATAWGSKEVVNLDPVELEQLNQAIESKNLQETENLIYKKAAELGIGSELRSIKPVLRGSAKPLSEWEPNDFHEWRSTLAKIGDDNIAQIIAVISQAAHNTYLNKSYPRPIQIISLLSLFKSPDGGLAQIATGEGKSLIVAMFAIIKVMQGRQVDIVTSSSVLAKRDVQDLKAFYGQLGVSVSHNIGGSDKDGMKACYLEDVVYGDNLHFIGDKLRDISSNVKMGRGSDLVIVDEVDNLFIDQTNMKVQLSNAIPGFEMLMPIYVYMRGTAVALASKLLQEEDQCYLKVPSLTDRQKENIENFDPTIIENETYKIELLPIGLNCGEYIKDYLANYTEEILFAFNENRTIRPYVVPVHLEQFVKDQLPKWIDSLFASIYFQEKVHYIVGINPDSTKYQFKIIAPMDYPNTGVIQYGLQWGDGLHPLVQVKHGLTMLPENVVSIFMSYVGFFEKYQNRFGVTGTLGEKPHHKFLEKVYGVELSIIPTFIEKDLSVFPAIIVGTKEEWLREIEEVVKRKISDQSRAGLVILETIEEVESLKTYLENAGYEKSKIFVYGTASAGEYKVEGGVGLKPGEIILATNMAGRGTDLKISAEVKKNGGLHVIMGVFSKNVRVQDQGFGRAARQGEPGSAQVIVNLGQMPETHCKEIKCLLSERKEQEIQTLEEDRLCKLPFLGIKDKLFDLFTELRKEIDSPTNYKLILDKTDKLEEKSLYLYEENGEIFLKIVPAKDGKKKVELSDITELLNTIDPRSTKHIRTGLSDNSHSSSSLNKQDYEIIHFIATVKGFTDYPEIYNRVKSDFNSLVKWQDFGAFDSFIKAKDNYLTELLKKNPAFLDLWPGEQIDKVSLEKAEMREKYRLWISDRELYNNQCELDQLVEYWGVWLKKVADLLEPKECKVATEEQKKQMEELYKGLYEQLIKEFAEFKKGIDQKKETGKFFENPNYPVWKAWQLFNIAQKNSNRNWGFEPEGVLGIWFNWMPTSVQEAINNVFEYFEGDKRISFGSVNFNPENPLESAKVSVQKAIELDDIYSWAAHNAKSCIELRKDGSGLTETNQAKDAAKVKENFYTEQIAAVERINNWIIPSFDSELGFLVTHKMANYQSDSVIQLIVAREIYKEITSKLQSNIRTVAKATGNEMIGVKGFVSSSDLIKDINVTEAVLNFASGLLNATNMTGDVTSSARLALDNIARSLNFTGQELASVNLTLSQIELGGGFVFEISTYELEEEKDWTGTILAVAIAVASIYTGLWLINLGAASIFATTLGSSFVMQGIGDLVQSVISVGTGNPINLKKHMYSKGMATGISLATAGTLQFLNTLPAIQHLGFLQRAADGIYNAAQNPAVFLATSASAQAATTAASIGLQSFGKNFIDPEKIETKAGESADRIIGSKETSEYLAWIQATVIINENPELQNELYLEMERTVSKERSRFHDDKTTAGLGLGTNLLSHAAGGFASFWGLHTMINAGVQLTMGFIQNSEAVGHVEAAMKKTIKNLYSRTLSTGEMMERLLVKNYRNDNVGSELYAELGRQGYVQDGEIDYRNCDKLGEVNLASKLAEFKGTIVSNCKRIGELLLNPGTFSEFKQKYVSAVKGLKIAIQENEILAPIAQAVAGQVGQKVGEKLGPYIGNKIKEGKPTGSRGRINEEEVAQKSGLNRKPETGKATGESQGAKTTNDKRETGESPWVGVEEQEVIIATTGTPGIRSEGTTQEVEPGLNIGIPKGENAEYVASKMRAEIEGKQYVVFKEIKRTLDSDGRTVMKEEIRIEAVELRNEGDFYITESSLSEHGLTALEGRRVVGIISVDSVGGLQGLQGEALEAIKAETLRAFISSAESGQNEHFGISANNVQLAERVSQVKDVGTKLAIAGEKEKSLLHTILEHGRIGPLSIKEMKMLAGIIGPPVQKFLSDPRVQGGLTVADGVGEMLVGAGIAVGTGVSVVGLVGGVAIVFHGSSQVAKGLTKIWTNKDVDSVPSIIAQQLGVPRDVANMADDIVVITATLGGTFIIRKIAEEGAEVTVKLIGKEIADNTPTVSRADAVSGELGLLDKPAKPFKPIKLGDFEKKADIPTALKKEGCSAEIGLLDQPVKPPYKSTEAGKIIDEVMDAVPDAKVYPKKIGFDRPNLKQHSSVDDGDLSWRVDTSIGTVVKKTESEIANDLYKNVAENRVALQASRYDEFITSKPWTPRKLPTSLEKEFEGGGSWIMTETDYEIHFLDKSLIGRLDGQFMTSSKKMDQAIKASNGDARKLEEWFTTSGWAGEKLYRIDIKNPLDYNPRMPHSRLSGASEDFIPGGFTKGNMPEIVIDPIPKDQLIITKIN